MSVFTGGPYGRLAVMLNTLFSLNTLYIDYYYYYFVKTCVGNIIRTLHEFVGRTDKSVPRVTVWHHSAELHDAKQSPVERFVASRENLSLRFTTMSDTNRAVQPQKRARGLKFWI